MKLVLLLAPLALGGCVATGPSYTPQELAAVRATAASGATEARAHKITWVEAARRDAAMAREIGGARVTADDELSFALHSALAAEIDAGRMTPEMANLKYQQHLAELRAAAQARDDEQRRRFGEAMMIAGQSMQNAGQSYQAPRPVNCTSTPIGTTISTTCR